MRGGGGLGGEWPRRGLVLATAALVVVLVAAASGAGAAGSRETLIASGRAANGGSDDATFSQDSRRVTLMAYDTAASNVVRGDTNAKRDVILFRRTSALQGSLERVSVGTGERQANGDSVDPSLDGDAHHRPHCVAFQSIATNLDPRDRSPDWDVYLRNLRRRTTTLVSVGQTDATHAVVDGKCRLVSYAAGGDVFVRDLRRGKSYRIASGANPDQQTNGKGVAYERGGQIYYQAYRLKRSRRRWRIVKQGRERLASAGAHGAGNGISSHPSLDDNGFYVAFQSTATNLCTELCRGVSGDRNGPVQDLFRRTLSRRAPTRDRMEMVSYSFAVDAQGNGPSSDPEISGGGEYVVFDSAATNLRPSPAISDIDPNGPIPDVYLWNFPRGRRYGNVSRESRPGPKGAFDAASVRPATSSHGNYIAFTSAESGQAGDTNGSGIPDVFLRFLGGQ
jgi:hypothetical protein